MTKRQPKGVPIGGEFAANEHDEATASLSPDVASEIKSLRASDIPDEGERLSFPGVGADVFIEKDVIAGGKTLYVVGRHGDPAASVTEMSISDARKSLVELAEGGGESPEDYGFWEGPNDPAIIGTDPDAYKNAISFVGTDRVEMSHPSRAQTSKALVDGDGKKSAGAVRGVAIDRTNDGAYDVEAPKDGTPLVVLLQAGENSLRVRSGRVVISSSDPFSRTSVQVDPGAEVVILAKDGSAINANVDDGAKVTVVAHPGARGEVSGTGAAQVVHPQYVTHSIDNQTTDGFLPSSGNTPF